jgi:hypothetical protein
VPFSERLIATPAISVMVRVRFREVFNHVFASFLNLIEAVFVSSAKPTCILP